MSILKYIWDDLARSLREWYKNSNSCGPCCEVAQLPKKNKD